MAENFTYASPHPDAGYASLSFTGNALTHVLNRVSTWHILLTLFLALVAYDQIAYIWRKGGIAGPAWKAPFIGPFLESTNPQFEKYLTKWRSGPLSCVSVFHKFVVIASTRDMSRKIFNSPTFVKPCVVDIAHTILRPNNWVFLDGKPHVDYRKGLNVLFTRQALESYLPGQEEVMALYFAKFVQQTDDAGGKPTQFMPIFREIMCAISCRTFVGHYLPPSAVKRIADEYYRVTAALDLVNFPIILPWTRTWYGKRAADMILEEFAKCAAKSKVRIGAGGAPECIMDQWVKSMFECEAYRAKVASGVAVDASEKPSMLIRMFTDIEISMTLFTFLFASQDATSSCTTWLFQIMADRPDVLDRVRAENLAVRGGDRSKPFTYEMIEKMTVTRAVVKETLRYRPPVIMVPYLAKRDFPITDDYVVRKGSMVVPSLWPALHDPDAYPDPDSFDPDRWITGDAEKQVNNWLVFGTGPHYCLGQTYAMMNLIAMIGKASMALDWAHTVTPTSEKIHVFATIFPQDHCLLTMKCRP